MKQVKIDLVQESIYLSYSCHLYVSYWTPSYSSLENCYTPSVNDRDGFWILQQFCFKGCLFVTEFDRFSQFKPILLGASQDLHSKKCDTSMGFWANGLKGDS